MQQANKHKTRSCLRGRSPSSRRPAPSAAKAGFAGVWLGQRTGRDAPTTLAVAGRQTLGIELGTAVVPA
ncbi:LLM class flavin-dependent oxidoreductase [Nonomuraea sp. CA-141351]|uniref:LLM class flavin-dependent oxidoreductase n=1 Tax=Nonomuraea sp. CA-141351 TaxID=3239996 RepID=UPI003D8AC32A